MGEILNFWRVFVLILYFGRIHAARNRDYNIEKLKTIYSWKSLDFAYPNAAARQQAIDSGEFNEGHIFPLDVDVVYGNESPKVLITIPRFQNGVPATLGFVTNKLSSKGDPIIMPYPNWEWNRLGDCNHLTSIYRIFVDDCGRIWVLDGGTVLGKRVCPPQLLSFSSSTDQLLSRYKFPSSQVKPTSTFTTPIVDIISRQNQCRDTFVYIADVLGYQMIVYNHREKKSWNIQHNTFNLDPIYSHITINNYSYDAQDGILSGALGPRHTNGDRILYFHKLTGLTESWVSTSVLRNSFAFIYNTNPPPGSIHTFSLMRTSQSSLEAMTKDGILFYGMLQQTSLGFWNSVTHPNFGGDNLDILVTNSRALQFTSGMKIRQYEQEPEQLWMMTIPLAQYLNKAMNPNVTNFRILGNSVDQLIRNTKCDWVARQNVYRKPWNEWYRSGRRYP